MAPAQAGEFNTTSTLLTVPSDAKFIFLKLKRLILSNCKWLGLVVVRGWDLERIMAKKYGSDRDDVINGGWRSDVIYGNGGDDWLFGSYGNDQLFGGEGDDTLVASYDYGQGDLFDGGNGNDTYQIDGSHVDHFAFDVNLETGTDRYNNRYISIENVIGGKKGDQLSGNDLANVLDGRNGDDVINGAGGNDVLVGGAGNDVLVGGQADTALMNALSKATTGKREEIRDELGHSKGTSIDPASSEEQDKLSGGDGNDLLLGMRGNDEISGGKGDDVVYGNSGNDVLSGDDGNDTIYGGKNNDTISDGEGNDTVFGDSGNDMIIAGEAGRDSYTGGSGFDTLDYSNSTTGDLSIDLSKGTVKGAGHEDSVDGIEHVISGSGDDTIKGSKNADTIEGGAGNDTIRGYKGADQLLGGDGEDRYVWERKDLDAIDTISDFEMDDDVLDFSRLIKATKYDSIEEVVRIEKQGDDAKVSVYSGSELGWQNVVVLSETDVSVQELADSGALIV